MRIRPGQRLIQVLLVWAALAVLPLAARVWLPELAAPALLAWAALGLVGAAWALDEQGYPIYPVVPGGERQREMVFRFGVNLAMYALTGNYKADQVHIPAILRRLGGAARDEVN